MSQKGYNEIFNKIELEKVSLTGIFVQGRDLGEKREKVMMR
jgi:hypothetical protein